MQSDLCFIAVTAYTPLYYEFWWSFVFGDLLFWWSFVLNTSLFIKRGHSTRW